MGLSSLPSGGGGGLVDHKDTHDPEDGSDPLDCGTPGSSDSVQSASEGTAHDFARSDHVHEIAQSIADDAVLTVDGSPSNGTFGKFTSNGIDGVTGKELKEDLGSLHQNQLSNSGFGVWSSSDGPHNVGSQVTLTDVTSGVCLTADTQDLAIGKLFKFDSGDFSGEVYEITDLTANTSFTLNDTSLTDSGSPGTGYEVTPGCTAADNKGPDGWNKTSTLDIYRQHNDSTYTTDGSFYSCKVVKGSDSAEYLYQQFNTVGEFERFLNRAMTFGSQVYSVTATDNVKVGIYHNGAWNTYSTFAGADAWEWQEITQTIDSSSTDIRFGWLFSGDTGDVAYVQIPMAVFGSSIGEGNYQPIPQEIIKLEQFMLTDWSLTAKSDITNEVVNVEAQSEGKIPKGVKSLYVRARARDSASATVDCRFALGDSTYNQKGMVLSIGSSGLAIGNNLLYYHTGQVYCDSNGDIVVMVGASGVDTLDAEIRLLAVQLR